MEQLVATPPADYDPNRTMMVLFDKKTITKDDIKSLFRGDCFSVVEDAMPKRIKLLKSKEEIKARQQKYNKEYAEKESTKLKLLGRSASEDNKKKRSDYNAKPEVMARKKINSTINRRILKAFRLKEKPLFDKKRKEVIEELPEELKPQPLPPRVKRPRKQKETESQCELTPALEEMRVITPEEFHALATTPQKKHASSRGHKRIRKTTLV